MFVVELAGRAVTMWGWLAGEPLAGRPQRAAHLQQAFASLHAGLHRVRRLPHVPATWGGRLKAVPSGHPVRRGIPDSQWFRLLDGFDEDVATLAAVPQTFVHGDLSPANVLSRRGGHSYIDWDLCQTGPVLLELAAHLLWRAPPAAVVRALLARAGLRPAEAGRQLAIVRPALRLITLRDVALAVTSPHLFGFARRRLARVATVDVSTDADRTKLM
jgi:Ser/Thr protein kinase RdoA (MazF antagonist)